jgi:hypothetical protein
MRTAIARLMFVGLLLCTMAATQTTVPPSAPAQKSEPLPKPESDRADESVLRQPAPLAFHTPDREQLRQRIETALRNESSLTGTRLIVNVSDDAVDISGNTDTNKQRLAARRIVQSFAGNMRVRERISVAGATPPKSTPDASNKSLPAVNVPGQNAGQQREPAARTELKNPPPDPKREGDKSEDPRR